MKCIIDRYASSGPRQTIMEVKAYNVALCHLAMWGVTAEFGTVGEQDPYNRPHSSLPYLQLTANSTLWSRGIKLRQLPINCSCAETLVAGTFRFA
jgi:hypothetical protein